MKFQKFFSPFKTNVRSYFRFHATDKIEEIAIKKVEALQKRMTLKKPTAIRKEELSSNIILRTATYGSERDHAIKPKNSVLYFPHFDSSTEVVDKICSVYHDYGLDVVMVRPTKTHFFVPENGRSVIAELVNKLSGNNLPLNVDKFLVHASSSGAFFYALLTDYLSSWNGAFNLNRIRGQIFDGLILGNPSFALNNFRSSLPKMFVIGNDNLEDTAMNFAKSPFPTETLVFHSFDDTLSSSAEELIEKWKDNKLNVCVSSWRISDNGDHYSNHPVKYTRTLESFLVRIGFV